MEWLTMLVAIDPGKVSGIAVFDEGRLCYCNTLEIAKRERCGVAPDTLVIEIPQVYPVRQWRGDPNDLIEVARIAGFWEGVILSHDYLTEVVRVRPHEWKGSRPKKIDNEYTLSLLSDAEREVVASAENPKSKLHNVIDAIGIGLWYLERR